MIGKQDQFAKNMKLSTTVTLIQKILLLFQMSESTTQK